MRTEKEFKAELKNKTISFFDECFNCGKENKLLNGLCCDCWVVGDVEK